MKLTKKQKELIKSQMIACEIDEDTPWIWCTHTEEDRVSLFCKIAVALSLKAVHYEGDDYHHEDDSFRETRNYKMKVAIHNSMMDFYLASKSVGYDWEGNPYDPDDIWFKANLLGEKNQKNWDTILDRVEYKPEAHYMKNPDDPEEREIARRMATV